MATHENVPSPGPGQFGNNVHPADRMGELKTAITKLQAEYDALRQQVIDTENTWIGQNWIVTSHSREVRRIPLAKAQRILPKKWFDQVVETIDQTVVQVQPIKKDAENGQ